MRILITSLSMFVMLLGGCSKDREDSDPCGRAIENAQRLVRENGEARTRLGESPITREECRQVSQDEVSCAAYASSVSELERCSRTMLQ
jgi:hypothetical protein